MELARCGICLSNDLLKKKSNALSLILDNTLSCDIIKKEPEAKGKMKVFLLAGQYNMQGFGKS